MFTGIVEKIGSVCNIKRARAGIFLSLRVRDVAADCKIGDSISVNGACLSVVNIDGDMISFNVIEETLRRTTIGELKTNDAVNLERSLKADSRISGHFVTGHVDYKGRILDINKTGEETCFKISAPEEFSKFIAQKGSIAVDGVSFTVGSAAANYFSVYLIPHTLKATTLGNKKSGQNVNIETDVLAKYLSRHTNKTDLQNLLKKYEYI